MQNNKIFTIQMSVARVQPCRADPEPAGHPLRAEPQGRGEAAGPEQDWQQQGGGECAGYQVGYDGSASYLQVTNIYID